MLTGRPQAVGGQVANLGVHGHPAGLHLERPWIRGAPHHLPESWAREHALAGDGRRALVVECGLGRDSEHLAGLGFAVVAFDFSATAIARAWELVGAGGTLLVIAAVKGHEADPPDGPWPLTRGEVESFAADGLELVRLEDFRDPEAHRWRAELRRDGAAQTRSRPT